MHGRRVAQRRRDMATRQVPAARRATPLLWLIALVVTIAAASALWPRSSASDGSAAPSRAAAASAPTAPSGPAGAPGSPPPVGASARTPAPPPGSVAPSADAAAGCRDGTPRDALARADDLLRNRYAIGRHDVADLPPDPDWDENPFGNDNWQFDFHSLRFVLDLFAASDATGDGRYRDRAAWLIRDWIVDNPRHGSASAFAWNDHATAWRATVLVCAAGELGDQPWLLEALQAHGQALASEEFYVDVGNHALNQNIGLLEVACSIDHPAWQDLAVARLDTLAASSIDAEGVTNEQAVFYQLYNWRNYRRALDHLEACGLGAPASFARVELMPGFLAHATLPNGEYVRLGDTTTRAATPIPGTVAEFAATLGERGPAPDVRFASYRAGFSFGRTGWGETRPFTDEVAWSVRHGPGRAYHGHADHTSVTLYGYGARLVEDSGSFTYNVNEWREYALSHRAHNVVTIDGLEYDQSERAELVRSTTSEGADEVVVRDGGYHGISNVRRIVFSAALGYLVVDDTLAGDTPRTFHQLWHLPPDAAPVATDAGIRTGMPGANVEIVQLLPTEPVRVVSGETDPVQGWLSESHEQRVAAPVADFATTGASVRYLTVIVPVPAGGNDVSVDDISATRDGFSLRVTVGGHTEIVTASEAGVTIVPG